MPHHNRFVSRPNSYDVALRELDDYCPLIPSLIIAETYEGKVQGLLLQEIFRTASRSR
jgi:hypothetical protein